MRHSSMFRAASVAPGSAPRKSDGWFCRNAVRLGKRPRPVAEQRQIDERRLTLVLGAELHRVPAGAPDDVVADDDPGLTLP